MSLLEEFKQFVDQHNAKFVDLRFTDIRGTWHHISLPVSSMGEKCLSKGVYFDGSSIEGWRLVHESDMVLRPDLSDVCIDPFAAQPTIVISCDVHDPISDEPYERDPRSIAKKGLAYLRQSGIGDEAYFGPEAEFFVFDGVSFNVSGESSYYQIKSDELPEAGKVSAEEGNHGHRPKPKGGYFPCSPIDSIADMRSEMCSYMERMGFEIEKHHHEVAPAQHEIGFKFAALLQVADFLQRYKYVVKNVAHSYGKTATFMPKPIYGDNGTGMHVHQSIWRDGSPLFAGDGYAGLSQTALYYIGGILKHAKTLNAFTNPTTNSYKRLVPGYEAPVILAYSARNRSAACRIPMGESAAEKRVEVRFPDPLANPYLAFTAMMMAGLDGIRHEIHPGDATDRNLFDQTINVKNMPTVSRSLHQSLEALEIDHAFLLEGGVFTPDFLQAYMQLLWEDVFAFEHAPHPIEYQMYYAG